MLNTICPIYIFDYQKSLLKCFAIYFLLHLQIYIKHIIIEHNDRKNNLNLKILSYFNLASLKLKTLEIAVVYTILTEQSLILGGLNQ